MKKVIRISLWLVCILVGTLLAGWGNTLGSVSAADGVPLTPVPEKPDSSTGRIGHGAVLNAQNNEYGYLLSTEPASWIDATSGTEVQFPSRDDDSYGPVNIGFDFPFFEGDFSDLYINTNGTLNFAVASDSYENRDIPRDTLPNNYIAPFWDDLIIGVDDNTSEIRSKVYYRSGSDAQGKYFVIAWQQFARLYSADDKLTFEVVLRENGDIVIQYQELDGVISECTVGIEDAYGVDGIAYVFNQGGQINTSEAIRFTYPDPSARVKIFPKYRGQLTAGGSASVWFSVINNGDLGADRYDLTLSATDPKWSVQFFDEEGNLLEDTNNNGTIDTGKIAEDSIKRINIQVTVDDSAEIGENIQVTLTATSTKDGSKNTTAEIHTALPVSFAQAVLQQGKMHLHLIWRENHLAASAATVQFSGSNLAVNRLNNGNYLYSWEQNGSTSDGKFYTDLRYTILSDLGGTIIDERSLTSNENRNIETEDRYLAAYVGPDGKSGVTWVRTESQYFTQQGERKFRYNVYFSILSPDGQILVAPKNVTQNTNWRGQADLDVPFYINPRIIATDKGTFVLSWTKDVLKNLEDNGNVTDIEIAIYGSDGVQIKSPSAITAAQPQGTRYDFSGLVEMQQGKVLLSYAIREINPVQSTLAYVALNQAGNVVKSETSVTGGIGVGLHDSAELSLTDLILVWAAGQTGQVGYTRVDAVSGEQVQSVKYLTPPNLRDPNSVSVAKSGSNKVVITWGDRLQREFMYYVLLDDEGKIVTPAISFLSAADTGGTYVTNTYGYGLASYEGTWRVSLPFIANK